MHTSTERPTHAKARWQILACALRKRETVNDYSIRNFQGYELFEKKHLHDGWMEFKLKSNELIQPVCLRLVENKTTAEDLIGFNNTGNVCIWPSEEVLAHYCIANKEQFSGKNVCELGGGMTSLAGMLLARNIDANWMLLSDGNENSCKNLEEIVKKNKCLLAKRTGVKKILWGENVDELSSEFDVIVCADCLFFTESHESLIKTMTSLLKNDGYCLLFAPYRGNTLQKFIEVAMKYMRVSLIEQYDSRVTQLHNHAKANDKHYNPDIHYPIMIKLHFD